MADLTNLANVSYAMANQTLRAAGAASENQKIDKAGHDFESLLMTNWLQQAEQSFAKVPGTDEEEESDSGKDQYMSLAMQSLGTAMSAAGGIGIAKMISASLHRSEGREGEQSEQ